MKCTFLYLDARQPGGYPRDVRWLAGALSAHGVEMTLVANEGTEEDGLDKVPVVSPEAFDSSGDVLHVWGLFAPAQARMVREVVQRHELTVVSPLGQMMSAHLKRKWWKKVPYLLYLRATIGRARPAMHVFSAEEDTAIGRRVLRPRRTFDAGAGLFPVPVVEGRSSGDRIIFFGRNDIYQKGLDLLVQGFAEAVGRGLDATLTIAGQPHRGSTETLLGVAQRFGVKERVEVLGPVSEEDKWGLLSGARALVFPSRFDGPPRPIREALALGTPVIVTPGTNMGAIVEATGAGSCVTFSVAGIAEGLLMTRDDNVVASWRRGVLKAQDRLSWATVATDYLAGYMNGAHRPAGVGSE